MFIGDVSGLTLPQCQVQVTLQHFVGMQLMRSRIQETLILFPKFTPNVPVNWQIETTPKSHKALKYLPLFENLIQFCNDGLAGSNIPSKLTQTTESSAILKIPLWETGH